MCNRYWETPTKQVTGSYLDIVIDPRFESPLKINKDSYKLVPYKYSYTSIYHSQDNRLPNEEGWRIAVWPNGEALACSPTTNPAVWYSLSLSSYDAALEHIWEKYQDSQ